MKSTLSRKILLPTLLIIAAGLVTTLVVTYSCARQAALLTSGQHLQRETRLAARLIDNWLQARMIDLGLWAQAADLGALLNEGQVQNRPEEAERFLSTQRSGHPYLEGLFVADTQGNIKALSVMSAQPEAQMRLIDRPYFRETLRGRQVISPLVQSELSGKRVFVVTAPIKVDGELKGVIAGVIDFPAFIELFFSDFHDRKNGSAFISDANGVVLTSSPQHTQVLPESLLQSLAANPGVVERQHFDNREHLLFGQPLTHTDWTFVITQPLELVLQPLNNAGQLGTILAATLLALISGIIFSLFHRLISQRLQTMVQVIGQVREGDLSYRIPHPAMKEDDLSTLATSFNQMVEHLEGHIALLNQEIQIRKDSEHMLSYHQENLETIIAERSQELEREIIERKDMEARLAQKEKLEMIGTLAGGVAHDLNNILSGMITYPEMLLLKLAPHSPLTSPLRTIKRTGEQAAAIVQDLLSLSGRRSLIRKRVDLNEFLQQFLGSGEFLLFQKRFPHLRVELDRQDDLLPIQGAAGALTKTILHLVHFAAMMIGPDTDGQMQLLTEQRVLTQPRQGYEQIEAGTYSVVKMIASGPGLTPEHLTRLFEPFYTRKQLGLQGTGLEMAVILGTVKEHQGFMDCSSDKEAGSRFSLYFPVITDKIDGVL